MIAASDTAPTCTHAHTHLCAHARARAHMRTRTRARTQAWVLFAIAHWTADGRILLSDPLPGGPYEVLWQSMFSHHQITPLGTFKQEMASRGLRRVCFRKALFSTLAVPMAWIMGMSEGERRGCTVSMIMQSFVGLALRTLKISSDQKPSRFRITWVDRPANAPVGPGRHLNDVSKVAASLSASLRGREANVELVVVDFLQLDFKRQVEVSAGSNVLMV